MANNKQIPEIRFSGFTDAWEQRKLCDVSSTFDYGLNAAAIKFDGENKYIRITDIDDQTHLFNTTDITSPAGDISAMGNYRLQEGDILFARTGASVGKTYKYKASDGIAYFAGFLIRIKTNDQFDPEFVFQNTLTSNYNRFIKITSQRSGQPGVNAQEYSQFEFMAPNYDEQQQIGAFFKNLDDLITLHQRECDKLMITKKSMLKKMFPKNNEVVPEIRFSGFTDAWEQRKLTDLCDLFTDGDWIESKDQSNSGVRLIQTGNIGITEFVDKDNKKWVSTDTYNALKCKEVLEGDILISRLPEPAGRACIMPYLGTKMITAVDCTIVRTSHKYSSDYVVQYLSTHEYFKEVNAVLAGGTRQRISRSNLGNFIVPLPPTFEEQQQIGAFFKNLDDLITLHQRELEKLNNIKKSMLEKMFV